MFKCIVVDDEKPARDELKYILSKCGNIHVIGEASNGLDALKLCEIEDLDLVFLDIKMPEISGIDVARLLMEKENPPKIIFVTAYDDFALSAFEVNAVDYLLKPIDEKQLTKSLKNKIYINERKSKNQENEIARLLKYLDLKESKENINKITVYHGNKMIPLHYKDIIYITVEDKDTVIYVKDNKYHIPLTLNSLMDKLDNKIFFRSHKSFIVNLDHICSIESWFNSTLNLVMKDLEEKVPVSRSNVKGFKRIMNIN